MPRYYLHLYNSIGRVPDEEGQVAAGPEAARGTAIENIRSILADDVRQGRLDLRGRIEVADETTTIVEVVSFAEAVRIIPEDRG